MKRTTHKAVSMLLAALALAAATVGFALTAAPASDAAARLAQSTTAILEDRAA